MDIYLATGFALLVVVLCVLSRAQITRCLLLIPCALALNGCLSLKLGSNDRPPAKVSQTATASDPAASIAKPVPSPKS
jgi:hypothetical protein